MLESQLTKNALGYCNRQSSDVKPIRGLHRICWCRRFPANQPQVIHFPGGFLRRKKKPRGNAWMCYISYAERSAMIIIVKHEWRSKFFSVDAPTHSGLLRLLLVEKLIFPPLYKESFYHSLLKFHAVSIPVSQPDITVTHGLRLYLFLAVLKMVSDGNREGRGAREHRYSSLAEPATTSHAHVRTSLWDFLIRTD